MLSLIYGKAFEVPANDPIKGHPSVRTYSARGRVFIGHDTDEIAHVCNETCASGLVAKDGALWRETDEQSSYVAPDRGVRNAIHGRYARTIDVLPFDPGDDPYVLCAHCGAELLRDDEKFEAEYGHPITPREETR